MSKQWVVVMPAILAICAALRAGLVS